MSSVDTARFLRPHDLGAVPRNQRKIQLRRILVLVANLLLISTVVIATSWIVQQLHRDDRFAIEQIRFEGARHTDAASLDAVAKQWQGSNLFEMDIELLRAQLTSLPWVAGASIEKRVPDSVIIRIEERVPVALAHGTDGKLRYLDASGRAFADLSVSVGNSDLPLVDAESDQGRARAVAFIAALSRDHNDLYQRVAEVSPLDPLGFRVWDREIGAQLLVPENGGADRWRRLHALARVERWGEKGIRYADLRFTRRIVVLPVEQESNAAEQTATAAVTNQVKS